MFEFSPLAFSYCTIFDIICDCHFTTCLFVPLMSAKFEIIGIKSRVPTSHLLTDGGGGGGRGVTGRVYFHLRNQNFYVTIYFFQQLPPTHTPQICDKKFMTPYPTPLTPSNLQTHMAFYLFCPSNLIKTCMKHKALLFDYSHRLMVSLFSCLFFLLTYAY